MRSSSSSSSRLGSRHVTEMNDSTTSIESAAVKYTASQSSRVHRFQCLTVNCKVASG